MRLFKKENVKHSQFKQLTQYLSTIYLNEIVKEIGINESYNSNQSHDQRTRNYKITLYFEDLIKV